MILFFLILLRYYIIVLAWLRLVVQNIILITYTRRLHRLGKVLRLKLLDCDLSVSLIQNRLLTTTGFLKLSCLL